MVNISTNINKTRESFKQWWSPIPPISNKQRNSNNDGRQFKHNQQSKRTFRQWCQHFHHYEQNKIKFKQWWSTIPPKSTKQRKFTQWCQHFHQYEQNKGKFKQWWSTIPPIATKQKKVWRVMVNNSTNINNTKEF